MTYLYDNASGNTAGDIPGSGLRVAALGWRYLLVALSGLLVACGGGPGESASAQVNFYNWSNYIHPDTIADYAAATGVAINYDVYDSNDVLEGKLLAGGSGYDVVVPTSTFFRNQLKSGLFQPLDRSALPQFDNLDPALLARLAEIDPDNRYAIPYAWGRTGLGINVAKIRERLPDAPLDSWDLLFDPEVVRHFEDCGVTVVDASDELADIGNLYLGRSVDSTDPESLRSALGIVAAIRPHIRYFDSSQYIDDFANGEVCLVLGWSGDIQQAIVDAREGLDLRYVDPKEGSILFFDLLAVPVDAPHPSEALRLIDYLLTPSVAAGFTEATFFASANRAAMPLLPPAIRDDRTVYPAPEVMAKLVVGSQPGPAVVRQRNRIWTAIKSGQFTP